MRRRKPGAVYICGQCEKRFCLDDADKLRFFPSTGICRKCYLDAMGDGSVCFAKKEYFDSTAVVCKRVCPDRHVCRLFIRLSSG